MKMEQNSRNSLMLATAGILALTLAAHAMGPSVNVRGTIANVDGSTLEINERGGGAVKVHLADNAKIVSVAKASLSDIKPGSFIGTAATPRTDGTLQAIEIHIFPEIDARDGRRKPRVGPRPKKQHDQWDCCSKTQQGRGKQSQQSRGKQPHCRIQRRHQSRHCNSGHSGGDPVSW